MSTRIRVRIGRSVSVVSLTAVAAAIAAAPAMAGGPTPNIGIAHAYAATTTAGDWFFALAAGVFIIAALLAGLNAPLRAAISGRRRQSQSYAPSDAAGASSWDGGSDSQVA